MKALLWLLPALVLPAAGLTVRVLPTPGGSQIHVDGQPVAPRFFWGSMSGGNLQVGEQWADYTFELLTQYGPIEYIWFDHGQKDGGLNHAETFAFCKSLQPDRFIGFNHGDQSDADIRLGEMGRPGPLEDQSAAGPHMKSPAGKNYRLAEFT
jgi:hypothetical protein